MANPLYGQNKADNELDKVGSKVIVMADDTTLHHHLSHYRTYFVHIKD